MKFGTIDLPVTEQWTYHAVANVILSHSLLRSFPEVDSSRTALTGISWGGYLTCIVSGLDNRFDCAVPVYGCGFLHENSCWLNEFAAMNGQQKEKWIQLWDPSKYVGSATMPMLFVNGGKDFAYPPDSHAKTFDLVKSPKYLHFVPDLAHGHIFDRPNVIEPFVRQQLHGGEVIAKIGRPELQQDTLVAKVEAKTGLVESTLHYTTDRLPEDPRKRTWVSRPAKIDGSTVQSELPPKEATAWFLTVKDERGLVTSTPLSFAPAP
jgi:dienelactone hydrolase